MSRCGGRPATKPSIVLPLCSGSIAEQKPRWRSSMVSPGLGHCSRCLEGLASSIYGGPLSREGSCKKPGNAAACWRASPALSPALRSRKRRRPANPRRSRLRRPRKPRASPKVLKRTISGSIARRRASTTRYGNPPCTWIAGSVRTIRPRSIRAHRAASRPRCCGTSSAAFSRSCVSGSTCRLPQLNERFNAFVRRVDRDEYVAEQPELRRSATHVRPDGTGADARRHFVSHAAPTGQSVRCGGRHPSALSARPVCEGQLHLRARRFDVGPPQPA